MSPLIGGADSPSAQNPRLNYRRAEKIANRFRIRRLFSSRHERCRDLAEEDSERYSIAPWGVQSAFPILAAGLVTKMPKIIANNYEMYYEADDFTDPWKQPDTIWIQHGFGRNLCFWSHWVPLLAGKLRVLRRDMRGHGQSADPGPEHKWSTEELLLDMKGFLDALGLEKVHYLGESIGGTLGIAFAVRWPERLKSLTLLSAPTSIPPRVQKMFALGYEDWPTALGKLGSGGWARALMESGGGLTGGNPAHMQWVIEQWARTPTHVLQGLCRAVPTVDVAPLLPQIKVPTLILAPANSALEPLKAQVAMRDAIQGARIAVIDGKGHEIYVDQPEACAAALLKFINSLSSSSDTRD
jgi:pimeloyl-ACP methyl ester carboxylesterase